MIIKTNTFNGQDITGSTTTTSGTVTYPYPHPYINEVKYDKIEYCAKCGKRIELRDDERFCKYCGSEQYRTTTTPYIIYHWNSTSGENTFK